MHEEKLKRLQLIANADAKYRAIKTQYKVLENQFSKTAALLSDEQQDVLWAFVFASDDLDRRLLEIACDYIQLAE